MASTGPLAPHLHAIRTEHPLESPEVVHRRHLNRLDRVALGLTRLAGEPRFIASLAAATLAWILWNSVGPAGLRFDPRPSFPWLNAFIKVSQICLLPLLLLGQHLDGKRAKAKAEADHRTALRNAKETELLLASLTRLEAAVETLRQEPRTSR